MAKGKAWDKEKVTEVLKPYFLLGYSVTRACNIVGIPQQTVDTWIQADEELRLKIRGWQEYPKRKARQYLVEVMNDKKNKYSQKTKTEVARYLLDRTDKDYKPKQEHTGEDGQPIRLIIGKPKDDGNADTD